MLRLFFLSFFSILVLHSYVPAQSSHPSAETLLKQACNRAKKEKKNVFVIFHSSGCGWCRRMDTLMSRPAIKPYFDNNYVILHMVVLEDSIHSHLETPGGIAMMNKYGGLNKGVPFWLVFDQKGQLLADSQIRPAGADLSTPGKNIGCPVEPEEITTFVKVLQNTSTLDDKQLQEIAAMFSRKK